MRVQYRTVMCVDGWRPHIVQPFIGQTVLHLRECVGGGERRREKVCVWKRDRGGALRKILAYILCGGVLCQLHIHIQVQIHLQSTGQVTFTLSVCQVNEAEEEIYFWFDMVWMFRLDGLSAKSVEFQLVCSFFQNIWFIQQKPSVWDI